MPVGMLVEMGNDDKWAEKRSCPRRRIEGASLRYKKRGFLAGLLGGKGFEKPVPVRNISPKGACFPCDAKLKRGSRLDLQIDLEERKEGISVTGEVVWRSDGTEGHAYQIGARFIGISAKAKEILSDIGKCG